MWKVTIRNPVAELYTTSGNVQKISHFLRSSSNNITVRPLPTHDASASNTDSTAGSELVSSVSRHRSVYRSKLGPVDLLSTSVKPLVDALNPAINMSRVALGLCRNPPGGYAASPTGRTLRRCPQPPPYAKTSTGPCRAPRTSQTPSACRTAPYLFPMCHRTYTPF